MTDFGTISEKSAQLDSADTKPSAEVDEYMDLLVNNCQYIVL